MSAIVNPLSSSLRLACTDSRCGGTKGVLDFFANGNVVYRHSCNEGHAQGFNIKHALREILRRDPQWLEKFSIDNQ